MVHLTQTGAERAYPATLEAEIVGIAGEAMANARNHSGCRTVWVTCGYDPGELRVSVRDDGEGFDSSQATPTGHWGLIGMRERAASIGASLTVTSARALAPRCSSSCPSVPAGPRYGTGLSAPSTTFEECDVLRRGTIMLGMDAPPKIRILAVDDHQLIRAGLSAFLGTEVGMEVVAQASNGEEAIERYRELRPDVVLMDLSMPVMDGLEATRAILDEFADARIVVLTTYDGDEDIHRALEAGARGYLLKDMLVDEMAEVIRAVSQGRTSVPRAVAAKLAGYAPRVPLTPRETEVLSLVAKGLSNAEVAQRIGRAEGTVKVHVKNILQKLGVDDRTDAVTTAMRRGFIRLD